MYDTFMKFFTTLAVTVFCFAGAVQAQEVKQILLRDIYVPEPTTLLGNVNGKATEVDLWGIHPMPDAYDVAGRIALEDAVQKSPVNCTIKQWMSAQDASAQCIAVGEADVALTLIERGYAMADRQQIRGTVFDNVYSNAETAARKVRAGVWAEILPKQDQFENLKSSKDQNFALTEDLAYTLIAIMVLGPFIGMLIVGGIIYGGFRRLINLQKYQIAASAKKDRAMREREKFIVAASLEGEMNTNRAKLDAFIIIYEELLKNLKDPLKDHKYKKSGDIIHEKPALSRSVYDSNIDKLDVLGQQIVGDITQLYVEIEPNPNYKTIEPGMQIEDVIDFVSQIVKDAEAMLVPIDNISAALNVIVRDKRAKSPQHV